MNAVEPDIASPADIYLLKVNNVNTMTIYEIYSELTIKTPEWHHWHCSGVFIVNSEQIVLMPPC